MPFSPDRYILGQLSNVYELSPSNKQARQHAHLVVFNDVLLIAFYRRRARNTTPVLLADKCFAIDNTIIDASDGGQQSRFLAKIACNNEALWFGFASLEKKKAFVKMVSDAKSQGGGGMAAGRRYQQGMNDYTDTSISEPTKDQERDRELERETSELLDDLGAGIACREYLPAVQVIDSSK